MEFWNFAIVQGDIDIIGNWSSSNRLKFNNDKCQWMLISKGLKNPECHAVDLFVNATKLNGCTATALECHDYNSSRWEHLQR